MPLSSKKNTAVQIANAVLDEARSGHVTSGTVGELYKYMMDAALVTNHTADSGLDALAQLRKKAIAASPTGGSLMGVVNTNLDATISSRASIGIVMAAI